MNSRSGGCRRWRNQAKTLVCRPRPQARGLGRKELLFEAGINRVRDRHQGQQVSRPVSRAMFATGIATGTRLAAFNGFVIRTIPFSACGKVAEWLKAPPLLEAAHG